MTWHVYPIDDLREHVVDLAEGECWCKPAVDEHGIVIHNALDQRERYEPDGDLKPH